MARLLHGDPDGSDLLWAVCVIVSTLTALHMAGRFLLHLW